MYEDVFSLYTERLYNLFYGAASFGLQSFLRLILESQVC